MTTTLSALDYSSKEKTLKQQKDIINKTSGDLSGASAALHVSSALKAQLSMELQANDSTFTFSMEPLYDPLA